MLNVPEPAASPAAHWTSAGRLTAAGALVLGAGFMLASHLIEPETETPLDAVRWIAEHPDRANLAKVLTLLAMPFLFGTALVYVLLSRQRATRLAYAGGILLGCGFVGLSAVEGYETLAYALAQDGRFDLTALAGVVGEMSSTPAIAMLLVFVPCAFFGLLASAVALWRSRAVPRAAVLLIPTFIVVDFVLNEGLGLVPQFAGPAISFVAASWIAWWVLRAGRAVPMTDARPST
jgi:hypothetical protein